MPVSKQERPERRKAQLVSLRGGKRYRTSLGGGRHEGRDEGSTSRVAKESRWPILPYGTDLWGRGSPEGWGKSAGRRGNARGGLRLSRTLKLGAQR